MRHLVLPVLLVSACATAGPGDPGSGEPGEADAEPAAADPDATPPPAAPDAAPPVGPGDADAAALLSAEPLGKRCNAALPCPAGYTCISLNASASDRFCTLPCGGTTDTTTCANGYTGPGTPGCFLADDPAMPVFFFCALACGPEVPVPSDGTCPANLTCADLNANGLMDLCSN